LSLLTLVAASPYEYAATRDVCCVATVTATGAAAGMRFNAEGPEGVRDHNGGGVAPRLSPSMLQTLIRRIEDGPIAQALLHQENQSRRRWSLHTRVNGYDLWYNFPSGST